MVFVSVFLVVRARHEKVTRFFSRINLRLVYSLVLSYAVNRNGLEVSETFLTNMPWVRVALLTASHKTFSEIDFFIGGSGYPG